MEKISLKSHIRERTGKKSGRRIRREGKVPGILYGHKQEPLPLVMDEHDIWEILHNASTENLIIQLDVEGVEMKDEITLVKEVQQHPVTGEILHIDLLRVYTDEKIDVNVQIQTTGEPRGVKEEGGILYQAVRRIIVNSKAADIPDLITIDVSDLGIGDSIHISDIVKEYEQFDFVYDSDRTIAHVSAPKELELPEEEVEEEIELEEGEEVEEGEEAEEEGEEKEEAQEQKEE
ncbi:MAG: 50S ribosomal protein L25 [Candidatus Latescibacteria bacterium]|nr:50S ribosomal protein L25 [bacterium]MBD3425291.1 50S ribosomal protein L25 [Candidatus Latescibacterota bacterium]